MSTVTKIAAVALTALALSSAAFVSSSEASPRGHGGGHSRHGGHWGGHGGHGGQWGGHGGHWGHRGGWSQVGFSYGGYAPRCRLVERINYHGEVVGMRRVCYTNPRY
jgi:hypothetical protein